jgi:hypothetical protein
MKTALLCVLWTIPVGVSAQAPGEIVGTVRDQDSVVNKIAQVWAYGPVDSQTPDTLRAVVDSMGRYRILASKPGRWLVVPRHIGYPNPRPVLVGVGLGQKVEQDLMLPPALEFPETRLESRSN